MDGSRDRDLYLLKERMNNAELPLFKRRAAWRKFEDIRRQVKDRKLAELRHCLIRAHIANDEEWITKYEGQIKQHSYRMGYDRVYEDTRD